MKKKLIVCNLPKNIMKNEIWELFEDFGTVYSVKLLTDPKNGVFHGKAHVVMDQESSHEAIRNLDSSDFGPKPLKIRYAQKGRGNKREVIEWDEYPV